MALRRMQYVFSINGDVRSHHSRHCTSAALPLQRDTYRMEGPTKPVRCYIGTTTRLGSIIHVVHAACRSDPASSANAPSSPTSSSTPADSALRSGCAATVRPARFLDMEQGLGPGGRGGLLPVNIPVFNIPPLYFSRLFLIFFRRAVSPNCELSFKSCVALRPEPQRTVRL